MAKRGGGVPRPGRYRTRRRACNKGELERILIIPKQTVTFKRSNLVFEGATMRWGSDVINSWNG